MRYGRHVPTRDPEIARPLDGSPPCVRYSAARRAITVSQRESSSKRPRPPSTASSGLPPHVTSANLIAQRRSAPVTCVYLTRSFHISRLAFSWLRCRHGSNASAGRCVQPPVVHDRRPWVQCVRAVVRRVRCCVVTRRHVQEVWPFFSRFLHARHSSGKGRRWARASKAKVGRI
jgi:hypothetical protein